MCTLLTILSLLLCHCVCIRPDITVVVGWALKINYLSITLCELVTVCIYRLRYILQ